MVLQKKIPLCNLKQNITVLKTIFGNIPLSGWKMTCTKMEGGINQLKKEKCPCFLRERTGRVFFKLVCPLTPVPCVSKVAVFETVLKRVRCGDRKPIKIYKIWLFMSWPGDPGDAWGSPFPSVGLTYGVSFIWEHLRNAVVRFHQKLLHHPMIMNCLFLHGMKKKHQPCLAHSYFGFPVTDESNPK